jgi:DNA invertase Pin-like site-specific DNA recombinase
MRALIYDRQSELDGTNDAEIASASQRRMADCLEYCKLKGHEVAGVYRDDDRSGFKGVQRQDFERLLTDAAAGAGEVIVAWKLDRISRNRTDWNRVIDLTEQAGIALASVNESIDTSTPSGRALRDIIAVLTRMESENISLRVSRAALERARAGLPLGGGARPFGYAADKVTVVASEAELIREAARRVVAGESLRSIARDFNTRGLHTAKGRRFTAPNLGAMLTSPRLIGRRVYKGTEVADGRWPAILDVAVFEQVRSILDNPARRTQIGRPPTYLLVGGLARCSEHGTPLQSRTRSDGRRYACDSGDREAGRVHLTVAADPLEQLVTQRVLDRLDGPGLARFLRDRARNGDRELADRLVDDERALVELGRARFVDREIDHGAYLTVKAELEERITSARSRLAQRAQTAILASVGPEPGALRQAWARWTLEQRRQVLRLVITEGVVVKPTAKRGRAFDIDRVDIPTWRA